MKYVVIGLSLVVVILTAVVFYMLGQKSSDNTIDNDVVYGCIDPQNLDGYKICMYDTSIKIKETGKLFVYFDNKDVQVTVNGNDAKSGEALIDVKKGDEVSINAYAGRDFKLNAWTEANSNNECGKAPFAVVSMSNLIDSANQNNLKIERKMCWRDDAQDNDFNDFLLVVGVK